MFVRAVLAVTGFSAAAENRLKAGKWHSLISEFSRETLRSNNLNRFPLFYSCLAKTVVAGQVLCLPAWVLHAS